MNADDEATPRDLPPPVTLAYLQRAALFYLERYASSSQNLRRVLLRKVERRCRLRGEDPREARELVEEAVRRAVEGGYVDDVLYAEGRIAALRRRGASARAIEAKLSAKGVEAPTIAATLDASPEDEAAAAWALARRRRLGPFRPGERAAFREKDLAALCRAGFSFTLARSVIDAPRPPS